MKLGKGTILAITECALFTIGAIFFLLMLLSPASPIWMLIMGISCGLAGALLWLLPPVVRFFIKITGLNRQTRHSQIIDISRKIQGADNPENDTYELHRADSYDNLTDSENEDFLPDEEPTEPTVKETKKRKPKQTKTKQLN